MSLKKSFAAKFNDAAPTETWQEKRRKYLLEKSKTVELPTAESAKLEPKFMFDNDTLVMHLCFECCQLNRKLEVFTVDDDYQKLQIIMCRICRSNYNTQRRSKFFNHDLMIFKKLNTLKEDAKK